MILDSCACLGAYSALHPRFARVFSFLASASPADLAEGRYEIDGGECYLMVSEGGLRAEADAPLEAHDAYIDIQIVIRGVERYGWRDRGQCAAPRGEFDAAKDIIFYDDRPSTCFTLTEGQFAIFFPGDAHAPLIGQGRVKKCVVKVKLM